MTGKEKEIIKKISLVLPKLDKEKQSYILGIAEGMVLVREEKKEEPQKV